MEIDESLLDAIRAHAAVEFPRESCGLVVVRRGRQRYIACRNIADQTEHFVLHPEDYANAEDQGEVLLVVHSHPNGAPEPSQADLVGCEKTDVPWLIVNHPVGHYRIVEPSGYRAPLVGRQFVHGVLDCYSLIQDYYRETLAIELPDFERPPLWWTKGLDLYRQHFEEAGFVVVQDLREHDGILMQSASPVPNHGAVYLGHNQILHHFMDRLSSRDIYGGYWHKITVMVLRHRSQL